LEERIWNMKIWEIKSKKKEKKRDKLILRVARRQLFSSQKKIDFII